MLYCLLSFHYVCCTDFYHSMMYVALTVFITSGTADQFEWFIHYQKNPQESIAATVTSFIWLSAVSTYIVQSVDMLIYVVQTFVIPDDIQE